MRRSFCVLLCTFACATPVAQPPGYDGLDLASTPVPVMCSRVPGEAKGRALKLVATKVQQRTVNSYGMAGVTFIATTSLEYESDKLGEQLEMARRPGERWLQLEAFELSAYDVLSNSAQASRAATIELEAHE